MNTRILTEEQQKEIQVHRRCISRVAADVVVVAVVVSAAAAMHRNLLIKRCRHPQMNKAKLIWFFLTFLAHALFLLFFGFRSIFVATFVEGQQQERPINN